MQHINDFADPRLIQGCVYCDYRGGEVTRDHVPSKVLLDRPYPENLPVVPSCSACNNAFSNDEAYVACLVECIRARSTDPERIERDVVRRILQEQPRLRQRIERGRREVNGETHFCFEKRRVRNVMLKLARGHAAFELSAPRRRKPDRLDWWLLPNMPDIETFDAAHVHHLVGEVGSRATQRMMVANVTLFSQETGAFVAPVLISDWVDVQEQRYRYLAVDDLGSTLVKVVIAEYFACEVAWSWDSEENRDADSQEE